MTGDALEAERKHSAKLAWELGERTDEAAAAETRVAELEAALGWLRVHVTNPEWTTPDGALALVNEIEKALFGSADEGNDLD